MIVMDLAAWYELGYNTKLVNNLASLQHLKMSMCILNAYIPLLFGQSYRAEFCGHIQGKSRFRLLSWDL